MSPSTATTEPTINNRPLTPNRRGESPRITVSPPSPQPDNSDEGDARVGPRYLKAFPKTTGEASKAPWRGPTCGSRGHRALRPSPRTVRPEALHGEEARAVSDDHAARTRPPSAAGRDRARAGGRGRPLPGGRAHRSAERTRRDRHEREARRLPTDAAPAGAR